MCDAIRRVIVGSKLKAAITMAFPRWGLIDCLMSLDVQERSIAEQLALDLFNAKLKWAKRDLQIAINEGITLIAHNSSKITLKSVPVNAILEVFGVDIYSAIAECPLRKKKLVEGKHTTKCVSMVLTKNGAIINLSLCLDGALQMQSKLYT